MKKAITILALIMMIFAVSCSNDTPAPANEVPVKEDIIVDTPALPETPGNLEDVVDLFTVISALTTADEAVVDEWTNYYNEAGEKVATLVDGDTYLTIDGDVLRAGDKYLVLPVVPGMVRIDTAVEQGVKAENIFLPELQRPSSGDFQHIVVGPGVPRGFVAVPDGFTAYGDPILQKHLGLRESQGVALQCVGGVGGANAEIGVQFLHLIWGQRAVLSDDLRVSVNAV